MNFIPVGFLKLGFIAAALLAVSTLPGIDIHNVFFDYVCFVFISAIVTGAPEPDVATKMSVKDFIYTWFYRSSHLIVASATAYFIHKDKWPGISGEQPTTGTETPKP